MLNLMGAKITGISFIHCGAVEEKTAIWEGSQVGDWSGGAGEDNKAITFIDPTTGYRSKIYLSDENKIYLDEYIDATDLAEGVAKPGAQIIPAETGTDKDMWVEYGTIEFDNDKGMFTVTDLTVKKVRNGQTQTLATQDSLVIRTIHPAG